MREVWSIHPKSGDYFSAQKNWRKKCVNQDNKMPQKKCVNLSLKVGRKSPKIGGVWTPRTLAFRVNILARKCFSNHAHRHLQAGKQNVKTYCCYMHLLPGINKFFPDNTERIAVHCPKSLCIGKEIPLRLAAIHPDSTSRQRTALLLS